MNEISTDLMTGQAKAKDSCDGLHYSLFNLKIHYWPDVHSSIHIKEQNLRHIYLMLCAVPITNFCT